MKVAHPCLTLCNPMDCTVRGILQARILEWVAFPSPEDLPNPGIEPRSPTLRRGSLPAEPQGKPEISLRNFHYNPLTLMAQQVKNLPAMQETKEFDPLFAGLIPESGRSPGRGNGNPLQYSCLENPKDRGAWQATVHGVAKS